LAEGVEAAYVSLVEIQVIGVEVEEAVEVFEVGKH